MPLSIYFVAGHEVFEARDAYFCIFFRGTGNIFRRMSRGFRGMVFIFLYIWSHVTGFSSLGIHISLYLVACHGVLEALDGYFCIFGRMSRGFRGMEGIFLCIFLHVTGFWRHLMHISIYLVACHGVLEAWSASVVIFGRMSWGFRGMVFIFLYIGACHRFSRHVMHISVYLGACHGVLEPWYAYFIIFVPMSRGFRCIGYMCLYICSHVTWFFEGWDVYF